MSNLQVLADDDLVAMILEVLKGLGYMPKSCCIVSQHLS